MKLLALAGSTVVNCGLVVAISSFYTPVDIVSIGGFDSGSAVKYDDYIVDYYLTEPCTLTKHDIRKIGYNSIRYVQPTDIENYVHCSFRKTNGARATAWVLYSRMMQTYEQPPQKKPGFQDRLEWVQLIK